MDSAFDILKESCIRACRQRNACAQGYRRVLSAESVPQMMAAWRENLHDVVDSKFADIIRQELPQQYPSIRELMNDAGVYLNECPTQASEAVIVLVTDTEEAVHVYDHARAYIVGDATVVAHGHSQVYNFRGHANVALLDRSYARLLDTDVYSKSHFSKIVIRKTNNNE